MSNVTKCFLAPAFADPVILQGLHRASKYPAKQLVIHSSEHFFLRPLPTTLIPGGFRMSGSMTLGPSTIEGGGGRLLRW